MTWNILSESFISAQHCCASLNLVCGICSWFGARSFCQVQQWVIIEERTRFAYLGTPRSFVLGTAIGRSRRTHMICLSRYTQVFCERYSNRQIIEDCIQLLTQVFCVSTAIGRSQSNSNHLLTQVHLGLLCQVQQLVDHRQTYTICLPRYTQVFCVRYSNWQIIDERTPFAYLGTPRYLCINSNRQQIIE